MTAWLVILTPSYPGGAEHRRRFLVHEAVVRQRLQMAVDGCLR